MRADVIVVVTPGVEYALRLGARLTKSLLLSTVIV
jgi:hypothetical protein